jgi:hypothetical protein
MKINLVLAILILLAIAITSYGGAKNDVLYVKGKAVVFWPNTERIQFFIRK